MNNPGEYLEQVRRQLRIILLGPGEGEPGGFDHLRKRREIRGRLLERGYSSTLLGEDILGVDEPLPLPLALVDALYPDDLILVLETGVAPLVEIAFIFSNLALRDSTIVFCRREHVTGRRTTPGDLIKAFHYTTFSDDELTSCELTEEFVVAADRTSLVKAQRDGAFTGLGFSPE